MVKKICTVSVLFARSTASKLCRICQQYLFPIIYSRPKNRSYYVNFFLSSKLATNLFVHPRVAEVRVGKDPRDMFNNDDGHGHYPQAVEAAQVRAGGAGRGGV